MQPAAKLVLVGDLPPAWSVENDLDAGQLLLGVQVDGHAPAVINDTQATIGVEGNVNLTTVAGERFIHRSVDDFLGEVVWPGCRCTYPAAFGQVPAR